MRVLVVAPGMIKQTDADGPKRCKRYRDMCTCDSLGMIRHKHALLMLTVSNVSNDIKIRDLVMLIDGSNARDMPC